MQSREQICRHREGKGGTNKVAALPYTLPCVKYMEGSSCIAEGAQLNVQ